MLLGAGLAAISLTLVDTSTAAVHSLPTGSEVAFDLSTTPSARLAFSFGTSELGFGYSPSFAWLDVTRGGQLALLHSASASYSYSARRLRLTLDVSGSYGKQSFLGLAGSRTPVSPPVDDGGVPAGGVPAPADPNGAPALPDAGQSASGDLALLPQQAVVETGSVAGSFSLGYTLSQRWDLGAQAGYTVSGGLGESKDSLPLRRGPNGTLSATFRVTRRDTLTSAATGTYSYVPSLKSRFLTLGLLETWGHRFGERTFGSVGGGATYLRSRTAEQPDPENSILASGLISFNQGYLLPDRAILTWSLNGTLGTGYNQVLGVVNQSATGSAGVTWSRDRLTLGANGQVTQTLPIDVPSTSFVYGAGGAASYQVLEVLSLQAGGSWSHQLLPNVDVDSSVNLDQWQAYVAFTLGAPVLTL